VSDLEERWPIPGAADLRDRLVAAYADPRRGYHDLRHLTEVLDHLDDLLGQPEASAVDGDVTRLAAWFHDAVYEGSPDDEERSAALAGASLAEVGLAPDAVAEVVRLVRLTREHAPTRGDVAGQVLCDADLAILASAPQRYDEYAGDVRREYEHLDGETFRAGRADVLRGLLARAALFHTPLARRRWEADARANLAREIPVLTRSGPNH